MDCGRRIKALEKKLDVGEPRELTIEFGNGDVVKITRDSLKRILEKISNKGRALPCLTGELEPPEKADKR